MIRASFQTKCLVIRCLVLSVACALLAFKWIDLEVRMSLAVNKVIMLFEMAEHAQGASDEAKIIPVLLSAARVAERDGTIERALVDVVRSNVVMQIIDVLRMRTGQDFGDDPAVWADRMSEWKAGLPGGLQQDDPH